LSEAGKARRIAALADEAREAIDRVEERSLGQLRQSIRTRDVGRMKRALEDDGILRERLAEVRTHLASLDAKERSKALDRAFEAGDAETLAALASAPQAYAFPAELQKRARHRWLEVIDPEAAAETGPAREAERILAHEVAAVRDAVEAARAGRALTPVDRMANALAVGHGEAPKRRHPDMVDTKGKPEQRLAEGYE